MSTSPRSYGSGGAASGRAVELRDERGERCVRRGERRLVGHAGDGSQRRPRAVGRRARAEDRVVVLGDRRLHERVRLGGVGLGGLQFRDRCGDGLGGLVVGGERLREHDRTHHHCDEQDDGCRHRPAHSLAPREDPAPSSRYERHLPSRGGVCDTR